jgi:hypothetical protein
VDVLEEIDAPGPGPQPAMRHSSSIAPVGLDLSPARDDDEVANPTMQIRLPARRRQLARRIVAATVGGCAVILVAAGVARVVHADGEPGKTASAAVATPKESPAAPVTKGVGAAGGPASPAPGTPAAPMAAASPAADLPTTGTVRLTRPARPGNVWLDGRKLTSNSALVTCGAHRIKVGYGRTHAVDVPCGGELAIAR